MLCRLPSSSKKSGQYFSTPIISNVTSVTLRESGTGGSLNKHSNERLHPEIALIGNVKFELPRDNFFIFVLCPGFRHELLCVDASVACRNAQENFSDASRAVDEITHLSRQNIRQNIYFDRCRWPCSCARQSTEASPFVSPEKNPGGASAAAYCAMTAVMATNSNRTPMRRTPLLALFAHRDAAATTGTPKFQDVDGDSGIAEGISRRGISSLSSCIGVSLTGSRSEPLP